MLPLAYLALFSWIPIVLKLFDRFAPQRAVIISVIAGTLFLPEFGISVPILPDYNKANVICYAILFALFSRDPQRTERFQYSWVDVPMTIFCVCPFITSMTNGLGPYDGFISTIETTMSWGVPYYVGRLYMGSLSGLRELAIGVVAGGVAYAPLCLYEMRFSPQLHRQIYGFHAFADFSQSMRMGGYRPTVLMKHGLMVATWMMAATLLAIWLWNTGVLQKLRNVSMRWVTLGMILIFIMMKSTGAYLLLMFGLVILAIAKYLRTAIIMLLIPTLVTFYLYMGVSGTFTVKNVDRVTEIANSIAGEERAGSLRFRLDNEQTLGEKARERAVFGWGGWGRARIYDDEGKDISVTDSLWIITFGQNGVVGLFSQFATFIIPSIGFLFLRYPARMWRKPEVAPAAGLAVVLLLFAFDCLLNAMPNPVFTFMSGGLSGLVLHGDTAQPQKLANIPPTQSSQSLAAANSQSLTAAPKRKLSSGNSSSRKSFPTTPNRKVLPTTSSRRSVGRR